MLIEEEEGRPNANAIFQRIGSWWADKLKSAGAKRLMIANWGQKEDLQAFCERLLPFTTTGINIVDIGLVTATAGIPLVYYGPVGKSPDGLDTLAAVQPTTRANAAKLKYHYIPKLFLLGLNAGHLWIEGKSYDDHTRGYARLTMYPHLVHHVKPHFKRFSPRFYPSFMKDALDVMVCLKALLGAVKPDKLESLTGFREEVTYRFPQPPADKSALDLVRIHRAARGHLFREKSGLDFQLYQVPVASYLAQLKDLIYRVTGDGTLDEPGPVADFRTALKVADLASAACFGFPRLKTKVNLAPTWNFSNKQEPLSEYELKYAENKRIFINFKSDRLEPVGRQDPFRKINLAAMVKKARKSAKNTTTTATKRPKVPASKIPPETLLKKALAKEERAKGPIKSHRESQFSDGLRR